MTLKKNDLKMMYSLRWKHDPKREASSFVFVYDIPAITMNYEVFKNYLLKNSGNPEEDIRVSYIKDNGKECSINSQADFQMALYTFRRSARAGNVINLLLERVSDRCHFKSLRQSTDVETQFDTPQDTHSIDSSCSNNAETPPEWFKTAMEQLKVELKNEILIEMNSVACYFVESHKLETIELKASECREKQLQQSQTESSLETQSSDSEAGAVSNTKEEELHMDARPINVQTSFPHMLGGEVYLHQWEVQNTGQITWDNTTELQYTWGSKNLVPVEKNVPVPFLKPGEKGVISVCLKIPTQSGRYECYWQFMHKGRRFGHSLGVQVIVDGFNWSGSPKSVDHDSDCSWICSASEPTRLSSKSDDKDNFVLPQCFVLDSPEGAVVTEQSAQENRTTEVKNSVIETSRSNSIKLRDEELDNIVVISVAKDEQIREGFIYVHVDGQKVLVPKNILKSELVTAAEELERSSNAFKSVGVIIDSADNKSSQPTTFVTSTPIELQSSLQEPLIPQQAVDLTTSPRDRRRYYDASNLMPQCSLTGSGVSEVNAQKLGLLPGDKQVANPFIEPTTNTQKPLENVLNINTLTNPQPASQTALNPVRVQPSDRNARNEIWISVDTLSPREQNLQALAAMGFWNFDLNSTLLERYNDDINETVAELVR